MARWFVPKARRTACQARLMLLSGWFGRRSCCRHRCCCCGCCMRAYGCVRSHLCLRDIAAAVRLSLPRTSVYRSVYKCILYSVGISCQCRQNTGDDGAAADADSGPGSCGNWIGNGARFTRNGTNRTANRDNRPNKQKKKRYKSCQQHKNILRGLIHYNWK